MDGARLKDIIEQGIEKYRGKMVGATIRPQQVNDAATRDAIRRFANGLGDRNPLWLSEDYARKSVFSGIVAPPLFLNAISEGQAIVGLPGLIATFMGAEWQWFRTIRVNDRFSVTNTLLDLEDKTKGKSRRVLQSGILNYVNQRGELTGQCTWHLMRSEAKPGGDDKKERRRKSEDIPIHPYSEEELSEIFAAVENEEIRGSKPRYYEDVSPGQEITPVIKGPLSISDMIAWAIGIGWHRIALAHGPKLLYLRENPALSYTDPETCAPEPIANSHFQPAAAKILMGSPLPLDIGFQRVCWLGHLVTNWMSDYGFLKTLDARLKGFVRFGDTVWCKGHVAGKRFDNGRHLVELELRCENQRGEITATGKAVVRLPSRHGGDWTSPDLP